MATESGVYLSCISAALQGTTVFTVGGPFDYLTDTISSALCDSATPPSITNSTTDKSFSHAAQIYGDFSANVLAISGTYDPTTSSTDIGTKSIVEGTRVAGTLDFKGVTTAWTGTTLSSIGLFMYDDTITAPADPMLAFVDFAGTVASTAGTYTVTLHDDGWLQMDLVPAS